MSKKIAAGANKIVIDVTCGSGAFMKNLEEANKLAQIITKIGELAGKTTVCVITNMDQPVGYAVGNNLEVIEAINILKGIIMPKDVKEILTKLGANMLVLAGKVENLEDGKEKILQNISNGKAYKKFIELVKNQGGAVSYIEDTEKFKKAKYIVPIIANRSGTVTKLDAHNIGKMAMYLGAGRVNKEDSIDETVGFVFKKKVGDIVNSGDILGYIHANDKNKAEEILKQEIYTIQN